MAEIFQKYASAFEEGPGSGDSSSHHGKARKKRHVDPNAPKRPLTAYLRFSRDARAQLLQEEPQIDNKSIMTRIGELWNDIPQKKKEKYIAEYQKERAEYEKALEKYNAEKRTGEQHQDDEFDED